MGTNWAALSSTSSGEPTCAPWRPTFCRAFPNKASSKKSGLCVSLQSKLNVFAIQQLLRRLISRLTLSGFICVSCRNADALTVSNCTLEKKKVLFTIARQAFATTTRSGTVSTSSYQLSKSYIGRQTDCMHRPVSRQQGDQGRIFFRGPPYFA